MTKEARAAELVDLGIDLADYISDAYALYADEETLSILKALRKGVGVVALQTLLTLIEQLSSVSPHTAIPKRSVLWEPVVPTSGAVTLDPKPISVLGAKRTLSSEADWLAVTYDAATGVLSGFPDPADQEVYWIPEMVFQNPYMWEYLAAPVSFAEEHVPSGYTEAHVKQILRVVDWALQSGITEEVVHYVASALAGCPFAYEAGTISAQDASSVTIDLADGTQIVCELPGVGVAIKANATVVKQYEPLALEPGVVTRSGGADRQWSAALRATSSTPSHRRITMAAPPPGLALYDRIRLRVLALDFEEDYFVRRVDGNDVYVEGELPPFVSTDWAYVAELLSESEAADALHITLQGGYYNAKRSDVAVFLDKVAPKSIRIDVAPFAPRNLAATGGAGQIALSWEAAAGAAGYKVYRAAVSGGPYSEIADVTGTSFTNTGLASAATYYYVVTAYTDFGAESLESLEASATTT